MTHPRILSAPDARPSRFRRFAAGMLGISLVGGGLFLGGVDAAPAQAAPYSPSCAAEVTSAALTPAEDLTLSGRVLEAWLKPDWTFANMNQAAQRGQAAFEIAVSPDAKAGDTYTLNIDGIGTFAGAPRDLVNKADGAVIATAKMVGSQGVEFTFTDYVTTHTNVTGSYEQSYGYTSEYAPGGVFQPGQVYTTTYSGCENGVSASFDTTTPEQFNLTGLRASWRGSQDAANLSVVYNGEPVASANDLTTVTLGIDRPGTKYDCSQLQNQTAPFGIGYGLWNGKLMTDAKLSTQTTGTPKPGEYRIVSCTDREIKIEWMPQAAGETFRAQLQTIPDGTTGWEALGRTPFKITAHEESLEHGVFDRTATPTRPFTDGSASGELNYVDPEITKVRAADGSFTLTVTNPPTDGVVKAQAYTDALYDAAGVLAADQLVISEPSMGTVAKNVWNLPMLAPGESATAKVAFDESTIPAGGKITNRFGIDKSDCVTGELDPAELGKLCAEVVVEVPPAPAVPAQPTITPAECTPADAGKTVWETVTAPAAVEGLTISDVAVDDAHVATVTATPEKGFVIDESKLGDGWKLNADGTATWTKQLLSKDCAKAVTPPEKPITENPENPAKPGTPKTPGLPVTGGEAQLGLAAGAGVLLLAGAVTVLAARQRRAPRA